MTLRAQLALASLALLAVPVVGWRFALELEAALREGQAKSLVTLAGTIARGLEAVERVGKGTEGAAPIALLLARAGAAARFARLRAVPKAGCSAPNREAAREAAARAIPTEAGPPDRLDYSSPASAPSTDPTRPRFLAARDRGCPVRRAARAGRRSA